jgi:uncharacterized protein (DUF1697 family)
MTVYVALLRGVNVGGKTLPMSELRRIATELGYDGVRTYIQSGNVVFSSRRSERTVSGEIRAAIAGDLGLEPAVIVRTASELNGIVEANPFDGHAADTKPLHVMFAETVINEEAVLLPADDYRPERYAVSGREVYLHLPNGVGRSPLATDLGKRSSGVVGTMRNWRSILALRDMATETAS